MRSGQVFENSCNEPSFGTLNISPRCLWSLGWGYFASYNLTDAGRRWISVVGGHRGTFSKHP